MEIRRWIKSAEASGWRIASINGVTLRLACACHGCQGSLTLSMENPGPVPEPCTMDHVGTYARSTFDAYESLIEELRRRRASLGLDQTDITVAMGMADGYIAKLESFARIAPFPTLQLWAQTLGLGLTTRPIPMPAATIAAIDRRRGAPYQPNQARFKHAAR